MIWTSKQKRRAGDVAHGPSQFGAMRRSCP